MRFTLVLTAVGLTMLGSGCALVKDTGRNLVVSVGRCLEETHECHRNRQWAHEAWEQVALVGMYSPDHADGFKEGYAEYLYRGGNGEPPVVAPTRYRRIAYQSPDGHRAVQDWFAGYRHGAAVAQAQGVRQWVTGPSALSPADSASGQDALLVRTVVRVYGKTGPTLQLPVAAPTPLPSSSISALPPSPTVPMSSVEIPTLPEPPALPAPERAPVALGQPH